ncbi:MAG: MFS transporter [Nostoc sp.]|uniref:MFS transporter n=2 Tax=Nostoc sp. TaxID=1180 RepID=UPI002FF8E90D
MPPSLTLFHSLLLFSTAFIAGGLNAVAGGGSFITFPTLVLIPLGGIIADRTNRHRILTIAQILGMLQSLALTWLALNGTINVWQIALLGVLQGIINAFDIPTRQAFLPEIVSKENLGNALAQPAVGIALYSSLVSVSVMLGPAGSRFASILEKLTLITDF